LIRGREADAVVAAAGFLTPLTKEPGAVLDSGLLHGLRHGVGLEIHEPPFLGLAGEELIAGDVIAVEPGIHRSGFGGCQLEDMFLITDQGYELLTRFPYDL
jgi:Xaa-Pro aminopeptidase